MRIVMAGWIEEVDELDRTATRETKEGRVKSSGELQCSQEMEI